MSDGPAYIIGRDFSLGERRVIRQFQCARCGDLCATSATEAEANREFLAAGMSSDGISSVCDDCYEYVMKRAREDGLVP